MQKSCLLLLLTCLCARADDIRTVDGHTVNLQPVHDWISAPKGERPMKHWKQCQITEYKGQIATMTHAVITTEGQSYEVLVKNFPPSISNPIQQLQDLDARIASLEESSRQRTVTGNGAARKMSQISYNNAIADAETLKSVKRQHPAYSEAAAKAKQAKFLAMSTGVKYSGLSVWDCGK